MRISIDGDISSYYVQTLCLVFYPGAKFSARQDADSAEPSVHVLTRKEQQGIYARVMLCDGGECVTEEYTEPLGSNGYSEGHVTKIAVGKAFFAAGKKLLHYTPQWGILTGIRPGKYALDMLERGMNRTEVKRVLRNELFVYPKKAALATEIAYREQQLIKKLPPDTCSVYISIPFCPSRCSYCSFVSFTSKKLLDLIPAYLTRLCEDIDRMFAIIRSLGLRVLTVYIGGGTPTTLTAEQLQLLLTKIAEHVDPDTLLEFSLEAGRPDTITPEKFRVAKELGVNRVSINPQTLNDEVLQQIGRRHTVAEFYRAYDMAVCSGIPHINTDLIAGLPGESFVSFSKSVDRIMELAPDNLTVHTFCVKKAADILKAGEQVYSRSGGETGKAIDYAHLCAKNNGYVPYYIYRQKNTVGNFENVGFSKDGAQGLYNILMMEELHSVFACGAGAVTKLVSRDRKRIERIFSQKYPYEYLDAGRKSTVDEEAVKQIHAFFEADLP